MSKLPLKDKLLILLLSICWELKLIRKSQLIRAIKKLA